MATVTKFVDGQNNPAVGGHPAVSGLQSVLNVVSNTIDFSLTGQGVNLSDTVQALKIAAGSLVINVGVTIITAEGATSTCTVGDGDGTNSWDASVDLNAAANTETLGAPGTDTYATTGKYYASADTIDLVVSSDRNLSVGKIKVYAYFLMI